jgi:mono/diheme cytochrome c family protein
MVAGLAIYKDNCAACHTDAGTGAPHLFPRLAGSAVVQSDDPTTLIHLVLTGGRAGGTAAAPTAPAMPAFGWRLNDADVATLLTYVRNAWGNAAPPVKADQVKALRPTFAAAP